MAETGMGPIVGVILAGGLARRMGGGDKCLRELGGKPILSHILERITPQVDEVILNANGDPARFADYNLPVFEDVIDGFAGPLAGVLSGLDWVAEYRPNAQWIATVPGDGPFLPRDLVARFCTAVTEEAADLACAYRSGRSQPVIGLWPVRLREDLRRALVEEELRKVDLWTARYNLAQVPFDEGTINPFFNTNRLEDLTEAEQLMDTLQ